MCTQQNAPHNTLHSAPQHCESSHRTEFAGGIQIVGKFVDPWYRVSVYGKGEVLPAHTTKAYRRRPSTAPVILNTGTRWEVKGHIMIWPLYSRGKMPQHHWIWDWAGLRAGLDVSERKPLATKENWTPNQPSSKPTTLTRPPLIYWAQVTYKPGQQSRGTT
jgi:hypothetical protein